MYLFLCKLCHFEKKSKAVSPRDKSPELRSEYNARILRRQKWRNNFEDNDGRMLKNGTISYGDSPKFLFFQIFYTIQSKHWLESLFFLCYIKTKRHFPHLYKILVVHFFSDFGCPKRVTAVFEMISFISWSSRYWHHWDLFPGVNSQYGTRVWYTQRVWKYYKCFETTSALIIKT